jgi:putative ABC transport system substrate-binding protein
LGGLSVEVTPKRLELLHELIPTAKIVALLVNPTNPSIAEANTSDLQVAARRRGLELAVLHASTESEVEAAFENVVRLRAAGLVIGADTYFGARSEQLAMLSLRHAVPTAYAYREFAVRGGLISYGSDLMDDDHLIGIVTGRILKGEKPADLPVQQSTKIKLIINLKTANALGITVPLTLRARADEVIE